MSSKDTSPPAFPLADSCCEYGGTNRSCANGMTLRDHFAATAMQGVLANANNSGENTNLIGELAYLIADSMLKARQA